MVLVVWSSSVRISPRQSLPCLGISCWPSQEERVRSDDGQMLQQGEDDKGKSARNSFEAIAEVGLETLETLYEATEKTRLRRQPRPLTKRNFFFPRLWRLFVVFAMSWKYVSQKVTSKLDTLAWLGTFVCVSYCYLQCIFVVFKIFSRVCFIEPLFWANFPKTGQILQPALYRNMKLFIMFLKRPQAQ